MQPIAAWLVARPQNGVLGLAGTLLMPLAPIISGLVMTLLVLQHGLRITVLQAAVAAIVAVIIATIVGVPAVQVLLSAGSTWIPALLLSMLVLQWRSLTLALQVSAILAIAVTLAFFVVLGDPTDYWNGVITTLVQAFRDNNLLEQAELLAERQSIIAPQMTMLFVFFSWSLYVMVLLLGYALYQRLPGKSGVFGKFRDLNFGRVLAAILAVSSVLALLTGAAWLQNVAFVIFAMFWMQGLAWLHWLRTHRRLPVFVLIMAYALLPLLNVVLMVAFAVVGYTDAWFDFRARAAPTKGS